MFGNKWESRLVNSHELIRLGEWPIFQPVDGVNQAD